jgi:ATP-dependent RNA helicase DeaD
MSNPPDDAPDPRAGFESLSLDPRVVEAVKRLGFSEPTPIQRQTIPAILSGRDIIGRARTGSGKTAAFGLPMLTKLADAPKGVHALVLAPTRELALQVTDALESFARGMPLSVATVYGGAAYRPQLQALSRGVPIVVGTPGRVIDHLERGSLDLSALEILVLDEADEMLRMGFIEDVERVISATPPGRQIALFSATMPRAIRKVAERHLNAPLEIEVESGALNTSHIEQRGIIVPQRSKLDALLRILATEDRDATLVFARTRLGCADVAEELVGRGLSADALHGDLGQAARERVLDSFRKRRIDILVATDVAARGIDVEHISHVINLDLPDDHESYVHRIGRTGRAGRAGVAISLVTPRESAKVRSLSRALRVKIAKVPVPTDADIDARRRQRLASEIDAAISQAPTAAGRRLRDELGESHDVEEIALAALEILVRERGIDPSGNPSEAPPTWARARAPRKGGQVDRDGVDLFLPVGKVRGIRPADLVGALTNELSADRSQIGRITILPHKTFLRVDRDLAERILNGREKIRLRNREIRVTEARPEPHGVGRRPKTKSRTKGRQKPRPKRTKPKKKRRG